MATFTDIIRHLTLHHHAARALVYAAWLLIGWKLAPLERHDHSRAADAGIVAAVGVLAWTMTWLRGIWTVAGVALPAVLLLALVATSKRRPHLRPSEWLAGPGRWLAERAHNDTPGLREPAPL
jgi:hypothetical protein